VLAHAIIAIPVQAELNEGWEEVWSE
jgi:hypothetical protein